MFSFAWGLYSVYREQERDEVINLQKNKIERTRLFLIEAFAHQKEHAILWWPICLGTGVSLYFSFQSEPAYLLWIILSLLLGALSLFLKQRSNWGFIPFFALCLVTLGIGAGALRASVVDAPQLQKKYNIVRVEGTLQDIEHREKGARRLLLGNLKIERLDPSQTPHFIRVTMRQKEELEVGQHISLLASLRPPSSPILPHGFDFQRFFYFKRIGGTGFTLSHPEILETGIAVHKSKIGETLFQIAEEMKKEVHHADSKGNAITQALLTGDRALIKEETWAHLRDSGLSHMLAISGLHVGLFSATVFFIIRLCLSFFPALSLRFPIKKIAAVVAFCAALFYTLLVGASVPTARACVMTGMFFLAIILDRSPFSVHLLAFAAFVILLIRPESLMSASFQMSFAAVMGLIIFYSSTRSFWVKHYSHAGIVRKLTLYFISVCATTVIATLVTTPFTLYHFQHLAVYGVLGNLLAVPVMAFVVMPMAVFSFFLLPVNMAEYPLFLMRLGVEIIMEVSSWVSSLEGASVSFSTLPFSSFCLFVVAGIWCLSVRGRLKCLCVFPLLIGLCVVLLTRPADILLSEDGKLWGIYKKDHLYVNNARKGKFTQKQWKSYIGTHEEKATSFPVSGCREDICCDEDGCRTDINNIQISFLKNKYAIQKECQSADFVIARFHVSQKLCEGPSVIDWSSFKNKGAHLLWFTDEGAIVNNVEESRGVRPWNRKDIIR